MLYIHLRPNPIEFKRNINEASTPGGREGINEGTYKQKIIIFAQQKFF